MLIMEDADKAILHPQKNFSARLQIMHKNPYLHKCDRSRSPFNVKNDSFYSN